VALAASTAKLAPDVMRSGDAGMALGPLDAVQLAGDGLDRATIGAPLFVVADAAPLDSPGS